MSGIIFDLAAKRHGIANLEPLQHPAGVALPFDGPADATLIIPEIRSEIRSGAYCADLLRLLPEAIVPGDRVLVIGAGLGVVSTTVARDEGVDRVIAVEANTALIPYLNRVHALNGVSEVETVNAVLAEGKKGRVRPARPAHLVADAARPGVAAGDDGALHEPEPDPDRGADQPD